MNVKKLSLNKETLRALEPDEAGQAEGGFVIKTLAYTCATCPINSLLCPTKLRATCVVC